MRVKHLKEIIQKLPDDVFVFIVDSKNPSIINNIEETKVTISPIPEITENPVVVLYY